MVFAVGCMPTDDPVAPYDRGGVRATRITMGTNYDRRIYYDVADDRIVREHPADNYSFAIATSPSQPSIFLNGALITRLWYGGNGSWTSTTTVPTDGWRVDWPTGEAERTAFGPWWERPDDWYVIHLGYDAKGKDFGYRKLRLTRVDERTVDVRYAMMNNDGETTLRVDLDAVYTRIGVDLRTGTSVAYEPPRGSWDMVFTSYTHVFVEAGDTIPYRVTGVLLNTERCMAARCADGTFDSLTAAMADTMVFTPQSDVIGYAWKSYDLDAGLYTTDTRWCWMLQRADGYVLSLHFLDFYAETGERGAPLFAMKIL